MPHSRTPWASSCGLTELSSVDHSRHNGHPNRRRKTTTAVCFAHKLWSSTICEKKKSNIAWIKWRSTVKGLQNTKRHNNLWDSACWRNTIQLYGRHKDVHFLFTKYYFKNKCKVFISFPNASKHLKSWGCRPSGFIVFECLETWPDPKHKILKLLLQQKKISLNSWSFEQISEIIEIWFLVCGISISHLLAAFW